MISIKKDGQPFDLGNIQMTFRLRSPLWNDIPSHTFSFELDATDHNLKLTGYLHRPTTRQTQPTDIPVQCNIHGWILGATLRIVTATEKKIKCYLAIDNGQMNIDWGDEYLDEMDLQNIFDNEGIDHMMLYNAGKTSDEAACQFPPVRIPEYFGKEDADDALNYSGWVNYYLPEMANYYKLIAILGDGKVQVGSVSVPMFYLRWVLNQVMKLNGVTLNERFLTTSPLKELIIFSNHCCEEKKKRYYARAGKTADQVITPGTYTGFYRVTFNDDSTYPNTDPEDVFSTVTSSYTIKSRGIHTVSFRLVVSGAPQYSKIDVKIVDMIIQSTVYHSGTFVCMNNGDNILKINKNIPFLETTDVGKSFVLQIRGYSTLGISGEQEVPINFTLRAGTSLQDVYLMVRNESLSEMPMLYTNYIISRLHMPHVKVKELLAWLSDGFGCKAIYDASRKEVRFIYLKDVLTAPATKKLGNLETETEYSPDELKGVCYAFKTDSDDAPLTDSIEGYEEIGGFDTLNELPIPEDNNQLAYVKSTSKHYIFTWSDKENQYTWVPFADYLANYTTGDGELEVTPAWHPPANYYEGDIFGASPQVQCKGSSAHFKVGVNTPPFVMMLYHGLQKSAETDSGNPYSFPFASGIRYNTYGEEIGDIELKWNGEKGLRETYWKALEEFYANRWGLKGKKQIDAAWLKQLTWEEGYLHKGREYLIDTAEFTVTQLGFSTATVTAWRKP